MAAGSSAGARYDHLDMVDETTRSILGKVGVAGLQVATILGEPAASVCRGPSKHVKMAGKSAVQVG
jgi:hypothetical protein